MTTRRLAEWLPLRGRWLRYFISAVAILTTIIAVVLSVALVCGWLREDPLERTEEQTREILRQYERTGDTALTLHWIRGEGACFGAMVVLGGWAVKHPNAFVILTDQLQPEERQPFVECFYPGVNPAAFKTTFRNQDSDVVRRIINLL